MAITLLVISQMFYKVDAQHCIIRHEYSIRGMILKGNSFIKENTGIWLNCLDKCDDDVRCQSFNYVISQGICDLNSRTKEARPEDFVPENDRFYIKRFRERGILFLIVAIFFFFGVQLLFKYIIRVLCKCQSRICFH